MSLHAIIHEPTQLHITATKDHPDQPSKIVTLLKEYELLFQPPTQLPPTWLYDLHIHLNPNTKPIKCQTTPLTSLPKKV